MSATLDMPETLILDPIQESERLDSLRSLNLLDTPPEDRFDRITKLAADFFKTPIAYVALIDSNRQWFKSMHGICEMETRRTASLCQYTIHRDTPFVIPDTHLHPIGKNHSLVVGKPYIRFYAGVPLTGPRGQKIGSFCLVDIKPREFSEKDVAQLISFAALVEREINLGQIIQTQNDLLETQHKLVETQARLAHEFSDAAKYVQSMLPAPFSGTETLDWYFYPSTQLGGDGLGYRRIDDDKLALYVLDVTGHGFGSALLAVTVLELLRNRAAQVDFSRPSEVIERLNRTFQMKDHSGKFFSVWYGVYSRSARTLTYANAGHPPALIFSRDKTKAGLMRTKPGGSVLGVFPELKVPETTVEFSSDSELYLFTDGLYELINDQGGRGSYDEFLACLDAETRGGKPTWDAIREWYEQSREKGLLDDDVTMLHFSCQT
ncbi:MAG: SpoIIE family protein phosphatase [Methylacidiphilales bacterium]|nr:SpoIIE family protein phosphatase [Candidatus Methylacidiphilales bacterium]